MVSVSRKTHERDGVEKMADNDEMLWLNEKHIEKRLIRS